MDSSSSSMQQTQNLAPDPNPQNPQNLYTNQHYYQYPPPLNPNPNLPIHPPGTNPYYPMEQFPVTQNYASYLPPYSYYQDPHVLSSNNLNTGVAMGAYPINPPQAANKWKKPKVVQSVLCEICNIECNTKDVLEVHKTGKKHTKNLSKLMESASNVPFSAFAPTPVSAPLPSKIPKVVQSIWCEICKIECNSKDILEVHNKGKKHIKKFLKLKESASNVSASAPTPVSAPCGIPEPSPACAPTPISAPLGIPEPSPASAPTPVSVPFGITEPSPGLAPTLVSAPFEIPGPSLSPAPSAAPSTSQCPMIGPQENPNTSSATNAKKKRKKGGEPRENLATKTRKLLEGGADAAAVLTCPACNVVCNSDKVYKTHLAGQKHATMMKKIVVQTGGAIVI